MNYWDDPNAAVPVAFCPICGGEIYGPSGCLWCQERGSRMLEGELEWE